jgi:hypothetical protein
VRAAVAVARTRHADPGSRHSVGYGVDRPDDLTRAQASRLIDSLKATAGS